MPLPSGENLTEIKQTGSKTLKLENQSEGHVQIKISCPSFIVKISWKFIIFTIADDIYLHFTSFLLNIYHFNGHK